LKDLAQHLESERGVDAVTQHGFTGFQTPGQEALGSFAEESIAKFGVMTSARLIGFPEYAG